LFRHIRDTLFNDLPPILCTLAKQDKTLATTQAILDVSGSAATMVSIPFRSPVFDVSTFPDPKIIVTYNWWPLRSKSSSVLRDFAV
jgi:hypothetical protein